jgi:hypothetical protein
VRFRDDTPGLQVRARREVSAWREENPLGTAEEMTEVLCASWDKKAGTGFPLACAPVLRVFLLAEDKRRAQGTTGTAAGIEVDR